MSFLFPNAITVLRPNAATSVGVLSYAGLSSNDETIIEGNIPARIQFDRHGRAPSPGLPGDSQYQPLYKVMFQGITEGTVQSRDIVVDELGNRYQISAVYWNPLITDCRCQKLEA